VTRTWLIVPTSPTPPDVKRQFTEILTEIEELPSFQENITHLIQMCSSDNVSVQLIAEKIQKDPGLTAQVLKLVNSAGYMNRFRNPTLTDAVKIIGLKVLRVLIMVSAARNVIDSRYRHRDLEQIWEESNRVSFFARQLTRGRAAITEMATVAGLLFELGKIILITLEPDLIQRIHQLMGEGRIRNSSVIEEITVGISHPEIGALIAEKWNFPEPLVAAIRYQHRPLQAPPEYEGLVHAVYLAVRVYEAVIHRGDYYSVEPDILQEYGVENAEQFQQLVDRMVKLYESDGSTY